MYYHCAIKGHNASYNFNHYVTLTFYRAYHVNKYCTLTVGLFHQLIARADHEDEFKTQDFHSNNAKQTEDPFIPFKCR